MGFIAYLILQSVSEHTEIDDLMTIVKWTITLVTPIILALVAAIGILWSKLNSKGKEYGDLLKAKDKMIESLQNQRLEDMREWANKFNEATLSFRQSIDTLIGLFKGGGAP